jgi:hypothetical protein
MAAIDGYEAEPEETRQLLDELIDVEDLADPTLLYVRVTKLLAHYQHVVSELASLRAEAVGRLHTDGMSYARISEHLGLSRARVQQLVEQSKRSTG